MRISRIYIADHDKVMYRDEILNNEETGMEPSNLWLRQSASKSVEEISSCTRLRTLTDEGYLGDWARKLSIATLFNCYSDDMRCEIAGIYSRTSGAKLL